MGRGILCTEGRWAYRANIGGVVAKLRMIDWMRKFGMLLEKNKITTYMNVVYVDYQS